MQQYQIKPIDSNRLHQTQLNPPIESDSPSQMPSSALNSPPLLQSQFSPIRKIQTPISLDLYNQNQNFIIGSLKQISVQQDPLSLNSNTQIERTMIKQNKIGQQVSFNFTPIKTKEQKSNFLSPGVVIFDNSNLTIQKQKDKDTNQGQKIFRIPYGTKVSNISEIKRKQSIEFDESLLQWTKTLKGKESAISDRFGQDSLVYSNDGMSNIFITPIKIKKEEIEHKTEKQKSDKKTAKTSSGEIESLGENNDESKIETIAIDGNKGNHEQEEDDQQKTSLNPRVNSRKGTQNNNKLKQQNSSKTLSNPSKFKQKRKLYHSSLGRSDNIKLKEAQQRKKQLQKQLEFLNGQINHIKQSSPKPHNNLIQRISISDDVNAKVKAIELVHRLNIEKKQRHKMFHQQLIQGNRNIFQNFDEIKKFTEQREQREKERKRIEVMERMKLQEIRKNEIKKQQKANVKFLRNVIWAQTAPLKQITEKEDILQDDEHDVVEDLEKKIIDEKEQEMKKIIEEGKTPELDSKKSRLKKIRNLDNVQFKSILEEYNALLFKK